MGFRNELTWDSTGIWNNSSWFQDYIVFNTCVITVNKCDLWNNCYLLLNAICNERFTKTICFYFILKRLSKKSEKREKIRAVSVHEVILLKSHPCL